MKTYILRYTDFNGKGQATIIRAKSGTEAWGFLMRIPTLNPRRKAGAFPAPNNFMG